MQAIFYILFSPSADKFYIGHTTEHIDERLRKHNSNHEGFTANHQGWVVRYIENYPTKELAYAREREVKGWKSKRMILQLIPRGFEPLSSHAKPSRFVVPSNLFSLRNLPVRIPSPYTDYKASLE